MEPFFGKHKILRVVRWAPYLRTLAYRIEHVPGYDNIWPEIMTRWMRGYRKPSSIRRVAPTFKFDGATLPPDSNQFKWPSFTDTDAAQKKYKDKAPPTATRENPSRLLVKGAARISDEAIGIKLRLLRTAHAGNSAHRGADPRWHALRKELTWNDQGDDSRSFVFSWFLCVLSKSGNKIPRPLSTTLHGTEPNEVIHFGYLFMGASRGNNNYVFVVKNDLSGY